jgi:DNA-directed RNA polymerase subunit N (RpoN/RPB10)
MLDPQAFFEESKHTHTALGLNLMWAWFNVGADPERFEEMLLDALGLKRFCCRVALTTHVPRQDTLIRMHSLRRETCDKCGRVEKRADLFNGQCANCRD